MDPARPEFSVVIPVYNGAGYIARAVRSALAQAGVRHEVIVVDDGSTDGSGDIAQQIDASVRVVRCQNGGQAAARNRGARAAGGDVLAFLDADDWWAADKLAAQRAVYEAEPELAVVFSDFRAVDVAGDPFGWQGGLVAQLPARGLTLVPVTADGYELRGAVAHALIRYTSFMHPSTVSVRRDVFERVGGFDETMAPAEDFELWIRLAAAGRVGFVGRVLATTEQRPGSQGRRTVRMAEQLVRLYGGLPAHVPDLPADLKAHVRTTLAATHADLGWQYREAGDCRTARAHYKSALGYRFRLRTLAALLKSYLTRRGPGAQPPEGNR